jgi:hypothetical protein
LFKIRYLQYFIGAVMVAALLPSGAAVAQKLSRAAPFPEASEELYGIGAGGKLYVFGGFKYPDSGPAAWQPMDNVFEYDWPPISGAISRRRCPPGVAPPRGACTRGLDLEAK